VKGIYKALQITPLFNIPYSPETNPIESCFAQVKRLFTRHRLQCLVNQTPFDIDCAIREAFVYVKGDFVQRCAERSNRILAELNFKDK
jgi:transposase